MLTLIPEDGTGLANANSYVSLQEADDYFATHPFYSDNWADLGEPDKLNLLAAATAQLDSLFLWRGTIISTGQALGWPRSGVLDIESRTVTSSSVPAALKRATCEMAIFLSRGDAFAAPSSTGVDRLKIDVIELQFTQTQNGGSRVNAPVPAAVVLALRGLGDYVLGSRVRRVAVG
jgi:hypothetical protein